MLHFVKRGRPSRSTGKTKHPSGAWPRRNTGEHTMTITATQLKEIRQEFAALKPASVTLDGNRTMSVKEAVFALAPTLERMKKRGFDTQKIIERLHEKGIDNKPPSLAKYLTRTDARRMNKRSKGKTRPASPEDTNTLTASRHDSIAYGYSTNFVELDRDFL